nr:ATP-binding cassette domain-containing protein [Fimbriimonadaceae bacterium]
TLEFKEVHFSYVPENPVLAGISFALNPGTVTALVGQSGGGKTTIASLLFRFYEPLGGEILVNGKEIHTIRRADLRQEIGIVPQTAMLFNGTLWENLRYGNLEASDSQILAAAKLANVDEFVSDFADGYQTLVGERGVTLSGGQAQRVSIARAILKNPRVLILDEATSALDNRNEALVRQALERLMKGRTTLVIAHRLSTIQSADKIVVLNQGKVAEQGTHAELSQNEGIYAKLQVFVPEIVEEGTKDLGESVHNVK